MGFRVLGFRVWKDIAERLQGISYKGVLRGFYWLFPGFAVLLIKCTFSESRDPLYTLNPKPPN